MTTDQGTGPDPRPVDADNTTRIDGRRRAMSMPNVFELIATIKDLHPRDGDTCRECGQPRPCRTNAYVDGLLGARFVDVR